MKIFFLYPRMSGWYQIDKFGRNAVDKDEQQYTLTLPTDKHGPFASYDEAWAYHEATSSLRGRVPHVLVEG